MRCLACGMETAEGTSAVPAGEWHYIWCPVFHARTLGVTDPAPTQQPSPKAGRAGEDGR